MANQTSSEPEMFNSLGESWTIVSGNNLDQVKCIHGCQALHSEGSHAEEVPNPEDDNRENKQKVLNKNDDVVQPFDETVGSSRGSSSDIAVIDDFDESERIPCSIDSSLASGESLFSFLTSSTVSRFQASNQSEEMIETLGEDLSDFSSITTHIKEELNSEVDFNPVEKHYVHVPNARLNLALNMVVVLAITAVLGLGVGNFIGWSTMRQRFQENPVISNNDARLNGQLTQNQITNLKNLQDELVLCIQQQKQTGSKVCLEDANYWKQKFGKLFTENQDLEAFLQNRQTLGDENLNPQEAISSSNDPQKSKSQCATKAETVVLENADSNHNFHNLKLDLIVNQMEHLRLLKNYEEIRQKEKLSKERLKELEEENQELKLKLVEEEQDDEATLQELEGQIQTLKHENDDLKIKLQEEEEEDREMEEKLRKSLANTQALTQLEELVQGLRDENVELKQELELLQQQKEETPKMSLVSPDFVPSNRIDTLKGQIDQVFQENEELRNLIVSLQIKRPNEAIVVEGPGGNSPPTIENKMGAVWNEQQKLYVNELKHENEDLKVEIGKMRYRRFGAEPSPPKKNDEPTEADNQSGDSLLLLQKQLNALQEILQQEKGEVEKWKQMYNKMTAAKKMDQNNNQPEPEKRESAKESEKKSNEKLPPHINWTDFIGKLNVPGVSEKLGNLGGAVNQILEDIWKMNASVGGQFQKVKEDLLYKWEELKTTIKTMPSHKNGHFKEESKENNDKDQISEMLLNTMKKVYRTGVKFLFNPMKTEEENGKNRFSKLTDSMKKIMGKLNRKWTIFKDAIKKSAEDEDEMETKIPEDVPSNEKNEDETEWYFQRFSERESHHRQFDQTIDGIVEEDGNPEAVKDEDVHEEEEDWFARRAQSREKHHVEAEMPTKFTETWELRRAKNRKRQREETNQAQNQDESNSEDEEPENDYLIERKYKEKKINGPK